MQRARVGPLANTCRMQQQRAWRAAAATASTALAYPEHQLLALSVGRKGESGGGTVGSAPAAKAPQPASAPQTAGAEPSPGGKGACFRRKREHASLGAHES